MSRLWNLLMALWVLIAGVRRRRREQRRERIVAEGPPSPRAEVLVVVLFLLSALAAAAFVVFLSTDSLGGQVQLEGAAIGSSFMFLAAALIVTSKHLIVTEELEEDYPEPESPAADEEIDQIVSEAGSRITRKGLFTTSAGVALSAIGAALVAPIISFGPFLKTRELQQTPWRRGRRLVDEDGKPYRADDISAETFYTAYPEGLDRELIGAPLVVVRVNPSALELPAGRDGWAPDGIVAYSKICTHAACAVALYRKPLYQPLAPEPALVCPCHYSTFDPARGAAVTFGPAGRPLPQLPLSVDPRGFLVAAGNLSGPPGPSWWGVRSGPAKDIGI